MSRNLSINYIELPANDFDKVKQFFASTFGWTFQDYGQDYCAFNDGGFDGGFYRSEKVASTETGSALIVFYADNLEEILETIKHNGGRIVKTIFSFPGGRRFHFLDPHGNEYAVWSE
ncbi:MAG: VOC family protein [Rhodothermales bacterium]|nr:VOC family protein [Rhodothermales bacterium]